MQPRKCMPVMMFSLTVRSASTQFGRHLVRIRKPTPGMGRPSLQQIAWIVALSSMSKHFSVGTTRRGSPHPYGCFPCGYRVWACKASTCRHWQGRSDGRRRCRIELSTRKREGGAASVSGNHLKKRVGCVSVGSSHLQAWHHPRTDQRVEEEAVAAVRHTRPSPEAVARVPHVPARADHCLNDTPSRVSNQPPPQTGDSREM